MNFKEFKAGKDDDGRRLDRIVRLFLKDKSLGEIYKLIRKGLIKVNLKKASPETHINENDIISIADFLISDTKKTENSTSKSPLNIIFENEDLLIIDKPYGKSVHNEKDGIIDDVLAYLDSKNQTKENESLSFRPGPLHRLDKRTTGLLAFSKSLKGAQWFSEGIKNHTIKKSYYGLASGKLEKTENWKDYLSDSEDKTKDGFFKVKEDQNGDLCETTAIPLAYGNYQNQSVTLVEFKIKTGRKHQIRMQSSLHKHPLLGDSAYGGKKILISDLKTSREFYLQAYKLEFPENNPLNLPSEIKIDLSPEFSSIMQKLECCEIENPGL